MNTTTVTYANDSKEYSLREFCVVFKNKRLILAKNKQLAVEYIKTVGDNDDDTIVQPACELSSDASPIEMRKEICKKIEIYWPGYGNAETDIDFVVNRLGTLGVVPKSSILPAPISARIGALQERVDKLMVLMVLADVEKKLMRAVLGCGALYAIVVFLWATMYL